jgi:hypothetical protein
MRAVVVVVLVACGTPAVPTPVRVAGPETLAFHLREGAIDNYFYRRGPVAAHLVVTSGTAPRILVAFPAGNEGVGLWFEPTTEPTEITVSGPPVSVDDGAMHGITARLSITKPLVVRQAALAGVRTLRDYAVLGKLPAEMTAEVAPGPPLIVQRTMLDGKHHLRLVLAAKAGAVRIVAGAIHFEPPPGGPLEVTLTATLDEPPLTPIETTDLLDAIPPGHDRELHALAFLSYREKLLAGSWRFLTYFGRDTLLTVRLLMPHARPELVEAGLGAVIDRLDPTGDVAHEEDIGDFAAWENHADESPRFDYKMIDDDFLLAPVLASYFDSPNGHDRAAAFVARQTPRWVRYRDAIAANLGFVLHAARAYAASPVVDNLVHLHDRQSVGDWRDSNAGLGDGRIPYDVNVALVPAALAAAARLYRSPLFGPDDKLAVEAEQLAAVWHVEDRFRVEIPADTARERVAAYASSIGVPAAEAVASIDGPMVVRAISLDALGRPIPVMNSDDGFALLFDDPPPAFLDEAAGRLLRPFPAGLRTPIGIVVANPVFAPEALQRTFTRGDYHGTVVWSWQQALLAKGLDRQLARTDVPAATRTRLAAAKQALWTAIRGAPEMVTSELWSWAVTAGRWRVVPFGQGAADADESDAAQLWSTAYLAIPAP